MDNVKILVACHKPGPVYQDDVYTPIHVGRAMSKFKQQMVDMIGDDIGDNISFKNPFYCELTAHYWAWKNLSDVEYVGLCHYRRYFEQEINNQNVDRLLGDSYDVLLVSPLYEGNSLKTRLQLATCLEDLTIFLYCLKKCSPEMVPFAERYLSKNTFSPYNMFVMPKVLFDEFAEWEFSIYSEMEKYVKLSNYSRMRRIYGYYGEVLLTLWCNYKKLKVR